MSNFKLYTLARIQLLLFTRNFNSTFFGFQIIPKPPDAPTASRKIDSHKPNALFSLAPSNFFSFVSCIKIISELNFLGIV